MAIVCCLAPNLLSQAMPTHLLPAMAITADPEFLFLLVHVTSLDKEKTNHYIEECSFSDFQLVVRTAYDQKVRCTLNESN